MSSHSVKREFINKTIIRYEGNNPFLTYTIRSQTNGFDIDIRERIFVGGSRIFRVGFSNTFIITRIFSILVVIILIYLSSIIGWIAYNDEYGLIPLALHSLCIFCSEKRELFVFSQFKGIDKT